MAPAVYTLVTSSIPKGYVAVDFYDGSILYDVREHKTTICDVDVFRRQPCVNDMGRMWGSSRFQAPEEYRLGAAIDEGTLLLSPFPKAHCPTLP
mgnify:CR=1 FL=1